MLASKAGWFHFCVESRRIAPEEGPRVPHFRGRERGAVPRLCGSDANDEGGKDLQAREGFQGAGQEHHSDREEPGGEGAAVLVQGSQGEEEGLSRAVDPADQRGRQGARHRIRRVHQRAEGREHPAQPEDARRDCADRAVLVQGAGGHREADARVPRGPSKGVRRIRCVRACEASGGEGVGVGRE